MNRSLSLSLGFAALFGCTALPAAAEDFEFDVPVELSKFDSSLPQGRVECNVYGPNTAGARSLGLVSYGGGSATFALKDGSFKGNVSVKFNVDRTLHDPAWAHSWTCVLNLISLSATHPLCAIDPATAKPTVWTPSSEFPIDYKTVKGCAFGSMKGP